MVALQRFVPALHEEWLEHETRSTFDTDKQGEPILLFAHAPTEREGSDFRMVSVLAFKEPNVALMKVFARLEGDRAELVDMLGDRGLNRGVGTVALRFLELLLCSHGVRTIHGWLSPVDAAHRDRQVYFYRKNDYSVVLNHARNDGEITKQLRCVGEGERGQSGIG